MFTLKQTNIRLCVVQGPQRRAFIPLLMADFRLFYLFFPTDESQRPVCVFVYRLCVSLQVCGCRIELINMKISIQRAAAAFQGSPERHHNTASAAPPGGRPGLFGPGLVQSEASLAGLTDVSVRARP